MNKCQANAPEKGCKKSSSSNAEQKTLAVIIEEYKKKYVFNEIKGMESIGDCVFGKHNESYASKADLIESKRDHHQCCLTTDLLISFIRRLEEVLPDYHATDFDDLWQKVVEVAGKGVGPVTRYDTTLRFSFWKGLPEPKYVYLHSANGPLKGARAYFQYKGIATVATPEGDVKVSSLKPGCRVDISNFPEFVQSGLDAKNIENLLCIFSDQLCKLNELA